MVKPYSFNYIFKPDWEEMWVSALRDAWINDMVLRYGSVIKAWNNYAKRYDEDEIRYSNRPQLVKRLLDLKPESVLDIGGGTGVFALPMARHTERVIVVEPSEGMCEILKRKIEENGIKNIGIIQKRWEDADERELLKINENSSYDLVLASHSLYYIRGLHRSFLKMNNLSKGYVYLFTGCSVRNRDPEYERLYMILHHRPLPPQPDYLCLYMILREIGIEPNIEVIDAEVKRPIKDMEELVEKWKSYLKHKELTKEQVDAIRSYVSKKLLKEDGRLYYFYRYKNAMIYWKREGVL